mgnify:CR=1 FL=1
MWMILVRWVLGAAQMLGQPEAEGDASADEAPAVVSPTAPEPNASPEHVSKHDEPAATGEHDAEPGPVESEPAEAAPAPAEPPQVEPPQVEPPQVEPPRVEPAPAESGEIETVDDLLNALQRAGEQLETLKSEVYYTKLFVLEGDEQTRLGTLYFDSSQGADKRRFAVHWSELRVDGRRDTDYRHAYIFDGEWLVERLDKDKQFIKRQVVRPGERFDPLRLGEGPFPIPIGQSRDDILERFTATKPALEEGLPPDVPPQIVLNAPTHQLRLIPKERFREEIQLEEIRIWYREDRMLPVVAWTRSLEQNESTVILMGKPTRNEPIDASKLDTTTPSRGWDVQITTYRESAEDRP